MFTFNSESENITIKQVNKYNIKITMNNKTIKIPVDTFKRLVREYNLYLIHNPEKVNFN